MPEPHDLKAVTLSTSKPIRDEVPMSDSMTAPHADVDAVVDARGMPCPIPVLKTRLEANRLNHGQVLQILSTDAGTRRDFRTFVEQTGHELIGEAEEEGVYWFWLRIQKPA